MSSTHGETAVCSCMASFCHNSVCWGLGVTMVHTLLKHEVRCPAALSDGQGVLFSIPWAWCSAGGGCLCAHAHWRRQEPVLSGELPVNGVRMHTAARSLN